MTKAGYGPQGMVGLMEMLNSMNNHQSSMTALLFATHPMSSERFETSVRQAKNEYAQFKDYPLHRDRYMDNTKKLRQLKIPIKKMQDGEAAMGKEQFGEAENLFQQALNKAPEDYVGLLLMSKCLLVQEKNRQAKRYADKAKKVYPREAQAYHISGITHLRLKKYENANQDFENYDQRLPGNPNTTFYKGLSLEGMQKIEPAARAYHTYLQRVNQGKQAQYAYQRLKEWGYIK
jgi:predicted Zn-dependent protease